MKRIVILYCMCLLVQQGFAQTYLPLTGGTLTGGLNGTTANFSTNVIAPNLPYGGEGAHTFLGSATSANSIWRAGFYTAFQTPGAFNAGDFGFVSIPTWGGQNSSERYNLQIGGNIGAVPVYRSTDINGAGTWYTFYTSQNFNPQDYMPLTGGTLSGNLNAATAYFTGNVGIGTTTTTEKLSVNGTIRSKEVKVETANWPDYVFEEGYKIESLDEVERFIKANKHLPGIPSAKEVEKQGISLGEMNAKLLQKIEELTLHMIEQNKKNAALENRVKEIEQKLSNQK